MNQILNVLTTLIEQTPWLVVAYCAHKICDVSPKVFSISILDKTTVKIEK